MSENAGPPQDGGWPPRQPRPAWRPEQHRPPPPEYQPVHHEPGEPGRPAGSPWRRSQRLSRPEAAAGGQYSDDEEYGAAGRFLPGFGDDGDAGDLAPGPERVRRERGRARGRGPKEPRARKRRRLRWLAPLAALLVIVVPLLVGGAYAYSFYISKYHPADYPGPGAGSVVVQVASGETPTSLGPKLQQLGVVASSRAFVLAAEHNQNPNGLVPGFYGMRRQMKASVAYALLLDPKNLVQIAVTIPEGWRLSQIVTWLGAKSGIPASAYAKALKDPAQLHLPASANGNPEGYLFPATYEVLPHETAIGVLTGMVQRFNQEAANANLPAAASQVHLSESQVIVMASLVQAEGGRLSDYPKIARVIYNRLAQGMQLELDSTVLYGLNKYGILASNQQLNSPSPYNTYRHKGLTPGPIDNPGNAAIQAVLHPAPGSWVYFVTVNPKTGETRFTSSPAEFEQFRAELQHNLGQ